MLINWPSVRSSLKGYCIEIVSIAISYLADYLLTEPEQEYDAVRLAIDLRIYYLSKNLLNLADTLFSKKNDFRHLYGGLFNVAVAAVLHPASRLPPTASSLANQLTLDSVVYVSGVAARLLIEMPLEKQWIKQYALTHKGKLAAGSAGVWCSLIPCFGISSPAFYWSGELFDSWPSKEKDETIAKHLLSAKANIPIQVIIGKLIKVCVKASGKTLPFPDFLIDAFAGITHRIIVDLASLQAAQAKPPIPITNPVIQCNASFFHTRQQQLAIYPEAHLNLPV